MVNKKISELAQRLYNVDVNRFERFTDYDVDLQKPAIGEKFKAEDNCPLPLFKYVNEFKLFNVPTYKTFVALLDNYITDTRKSEQLTQNELNEEDAFLNACLETSVMQELKDFLVEEGKINNDPIELKNLLSDIWFQFYSRSAKNQQTRDSSAFEHVFVGERKQGTVLGCHSWVQYYLMERKNLTNYYGYFPDDCGYHNDDPFMLAMQFYQFGELKTLGGFLLGVSPEFELALYTAIFLCCGERTHVNFEGMDIVFQCFKMERDDDVVMATLFPSKLKSHHS